ncbi:MAG: hypothetical protein K6T75_08930 [Acetobacteraceae bacterium]|nr:hypothetical protein [Acetobacteraceae bacterium]
MNCFECGAPAVGVCRFCGRAVCKNHVQTMPYIVALYQGRDGVTKAVAVSDVLYCGFCRPQPRPVPMPELV